MVKIYKQPFAHDGDTIVIPDASQPDGKMSSTDGWTPDYQLPKADPNYKPVGRQEMNGVFKEVTEALGQVQVQGAASWSADGAPYPINAQVYHSGKQWLALRANSVAPTEGADWAAIGTAATYDVGEATGQVMQVGAFGAGHTFTGGIFDANEIADLVDHKSGLYQHVSTIGSANVPYIYVYIQQLFYEDGNVTQIAYGYNTPVVWVRHRYQGVWSPWEKQLSTNDILQAPGNSTEFPMSQKSVSDQLIGVGKTWSNVTATRAWDTEYTNTKGRTLPIAVIVRDPVAGNLSAKLFIDGELHSEVYTGGSFTQTLCTDIPDGSTYELKRIDSNDVIVSWKEL